MPRRAILIGATSMGGGIDVAELIARVAKLETQIKNMAARLERIEAAANRVRDQRQADAEYEISSLIG
jgi:outer membrane murein-binding lipoprotein Lpp